MAAIAALFSTSSLSFSSSSRKATFYCSCSAKPPPPRKHVFDKNRTHEVERVSQRRGKEDGHAVKSVKNKDKSLLYDYDLEEQQVPDSIDIASSFLNAVVKVYCTHTAPDYSLPWQKQRQYASTGSAFMIGDGKLLTNAHCVQHSSQVKVKKRGDDTKYVAKVLAIGIECDIALISVENEKFWKGAESLSFGRLPSLQDSVTVVGYPLGGDTISVTKGIVSRIEVTSYAHGSSDLLGIQIDAAINSGNSGGPAFNEQGECIGVAFQVYRGDDAENIGYVIPTTVVSHFLNDYERNGKYTVSIILSHSHRHIVMARAFTSLASGVTPLTRNSSFNIPITLRPSFSLFSAGKCSSLSLPLSCKCNSTSISATKSSRKPVISEGRDEDLTRHICPGCGVFMQDSDPNLPGYYKTPTTSRDADADAVHLPDSDDFSEIEDELVNELSEESDSDEEMEDLSDYVEIDLGSDWEDNRTLEKSTKGKTFKFDMKNKVKAELASASFSDFVEINLGSDWEDNGTLKNSTQGKTLNFDRKNKVKAELASASVEQNDFDKEAVELSDLDQMGNGGFEQDSNFKEEEILESEMDKNIGENSKGNKKRSSKRKFRRKSRFKFSGLDQFLEEEESEESEDGSFSISDVDEGFEEFEDLDEEETDWDKDWDELDEEEKRKMEMDGFAPPGVGYGNITEEYLKKIKKEKISKSEKKRKLREEAKRAKQEAGMVTVCARCHSLRNYGQIKNPNVENLIPDFDFDRFISTRLMKPAGATSVVVMVVDCTDFDGSFPKVAAKSLFKALEGARSKVSKLPKLILVATKVDLLPSQVSPARLNNWVRGRAKANGAHKLDSVIQVSSHKDLNIRNLISCIKQSAGPRGNVWVVGAQNAGKSTLINAFAKKEGVKIAKLTEAAVPGTTLGILRVTGILPAKVKMYDTPGLLHPGLMMNRLYREEQKMVEIRKELRPRSYRVKAGQTVHVGGLMRLDLIEASVQTIYITVWASPSISLHMGKIDNADELRKSHFGARLQPPIGQDRVAELGDWKKRDFKVCGTSWDVNSVDIAVSGAGWFSLGIKGEAKVVLWTFAGVEVVQREPLVLDRAPFLERSGFLLPQAISDLIGKENKRKSEARKKREEQIEDEDLLLEASV